MLKNIYTCNMKALPSEFFIHPFWGVHHGNTLDPLEKYDSCLRKENVLGDLKHCHSHLRSVCGVRMNQVSPRNMYVCSQHLWRNNSRIITTENITQFTEYTHCIRESLNKINTCLPILTDTCKSSAITVIKTVRLTMATAGLLMEALPRLHILHLVRDPLAVSAARQASPWSRGLNDDHKDRVASSRVYCQTALADIGESNRLQDLYPGRILTLRYQDFTQDPEGLQADVYTFLNITSTTDRIHSVKLNSENLQKWKTTINSSELKGVINNCGKFFQELKMK